MNKICSVDGCNNKHQAKGFCDKHYRKWKRHGDPLTIADRQETNRKISNALTNKKKSDKHKKNLSIARIGMPSPRRGVKIPEEQKQRQRDKMKGRPSGFKDHHQPDSAKKTLSELAKGRPSPRKGIPHTKEANEKNRQKHLGKTPTTDTRKKMSISQNKPETLQKNKDRRANQVFPKHDTVPEKFMQELCKNAEIQFTTHKNFNLDFQWHQVDIFIEPNICVEVDGDYTHANPNPYLTPSRTSTVQPGIKPDKIIHRRTAREIREVDRRITETLIQQGNHVLRFWQSELEQNPEKCIQKIIENMNKSN